VGRDNLGTTVDALAVNFQEVVHSVLRRSADVAKRH
jgi:hypothetical protein